MTDLIRWFACRFLMGGHIYSEWTPAVEVQETYSWLVSEPYLTPSWPTEVRYCLRCHSDAQQRMVR